MEWKDHEDYVQSVNRKVKARWKKGIKKYDSEKLGFQGDPLAHLEEELYDALLYVHYLRRKLGAMGYPMTRVEPEPEPTPPVAVADEEDDCLD